MLYDYIAAQPVRRLIEHAGFHAVEADEVVKECFESLWENDCKRLRTFCGETEAELQRWLVRVVTNYTRNWIKRHWRATKRERQALKAVAKRPAAGPTEGQMSALFDEMEAALSHEKVDHLRQLVGLDGPAPGPDPSPPPPHAVPTRTERQWKQDLEPDVMDFLGMVPPPKSKRRKVN